jgi:hypothetical protein
LSLLEVNQINCKLGPSDQIRESLYVKPWHWLDVSAVLGNEGLVLYLLYILLTLRGPIYDVKAMVEIVSHN